MSSLIKLGKAKNSELDQVDQKILAIIQSDCKTPLAKIGQAVGMSAPSVIERVRKLEAASVIRSYRAELDARRLGLDIAAFIGIVFDYPKAIAAFGREVLGIPEVLECHHVTGEHTMLLKVKTENTSSLERLISRLRSIDGVDSTQTMVVLSTLTERNAVPLEASGEAPPKSHAERRRGRK